ncbi:FGGY family carbohydrate kinase [Aureimonas altamirensis]|uniref:FGGY family carbohydrate kinase n=1 Tax=Aureimonas altamirensis TaxID=370622 RepID=UPI002036CAB8|nr:FGGY family carbohydrate kinase [Aureimonas altamirensis]MCM2504319.1 FGGY family carbohydrate kinase [Aureimonas altamirensis]
MTMLQQAILAIDEGTSGTRAALVRADGGVTAPAYAPLKVTTPRHGVVEQDADALLETTLTMCRKVIASAPAEGLEIAALALTTQRATGVLWDTETGRSLVPAMVWQDTRFSEELKALSPHWDRALIERAGRPIGARAIYLWAARHMRNTPCVSDALKKNRLAFGTVDSWLLWHLSEVRQVVTTPTNATSCGAYDLRTHSYIDEWLRAQEFPEELLPVLREDADDFGHTRRDILGMRVPIMASMGDQLAGLVGLGCHDSGQAMCVHGTGSFVDLVIGQERPARPGAFEATFTMTAWRKGGRSNLAVETYAATTGSALNWLCNDMRWFDDARQISALAAMADGARGIRFVPTLTGLRQPVMEPAARASLTGLSMTHTREELAYAVLEGIAHSVVSCVEADELVAGKRMHELVAGGGLSSSDPLLRMQADLGGVPVRRMPDAERASLRGTAFMAGARGLMWSDLSEARSTLPRGETFEPSLSDDERLARRAGWQAAISDEIGRTRAGAYENHLPPARSGG